jgi:MvaI/BcnI restriction endonuclease family protein
MNTRPLTKEESGRLQELTSSGLDCCLIYLTETGLKKSILDATHPVRELLIENSIHDFLQQKQGEQNKVISEGVIFDQGIPEKIEISLYRPKTKKGDPRIWPYRLKKYAKPNDVLAIFIFNKKINFINLSQEYDVFITDTETPLSELLLNLRLEYNRIADELLYALRNIANKGPLKSVCEGDTAIGRTIETALGIDINSSPLPDYKGIEIKSKRRAAAVRSNLFAQVPDWSISHYKSSREIVDKFGYDIPSQECRKLYCTVTTRKENSQGLILNLDMDNDLLHELILNKKIESPVCIWKLNKLHERLQEKHRETFWINADEINNSDGKYFVLKSIKHTRRPSNKQFDRLLDSGEITLDHLIKKTRNRVVEKGPLFKIKPATINELFLGETKEYNLI